MFCVCTWKELVCLDHALCMNCSEQDSMNEQMHTSAHVHVFLHSHEGWDGDHIESRHEVEGILAQHWEDAIVERCGNGSKYNLRTENNREE